MNLGLKDYKPMYTWHRPIANLRDFYYEIKYAFQRFWRGYDDMLLIELDQKLDELITKAIEWLRHNRMGSPVLNSEDKCHEDWNTVLDEILHHFKEANDETCSEKNEYEYFIDILMSKTTQKDKELEEKWWSREQEVIKYKQQHHKQAYLMVAEHIGRFWS